MSNEVTAKQVHALFDAMMALGIKEVTFSKVRDKDLFDRIDKWFMSRSKSVSPSRYVWGESDGSIWSYVRDGETEEYENHLKISFTKY